MDKLNYRNKQSAASSALGYLYQVRYTLFESLNRLRHFQEFSVFIETLDDVVFDEVGEAPELFQTKHHLSRPADLTDGSSDLWKTIFNWCEAIRTCSIPSGTLFFLVTTSESVDGSVAHYLKIGSSRNPDRAMQHLNSIAETSTNQTNGPAYQAYRSLDLKQRRQLIEYIFIVDSAPNIQDLDQALKEMVYGFAPTQFIESFQQRLEGWWYRRVITHLFKKTVSPILSEEIETETALLREQFKQENLPIDDDIMSASIDASGYQDCIFVHQLKLIEIGNPRILYAIKNYFRAFEQRSRWIREDLLLVGELENYEDRLIEEWDLYFQQMIDELGVNASEKAKKVAAQIVYKWVETALHPQIRPGVIEPSISRGTYQILSNSQRVGWHIEFKERLRKLLETQEATL